MTDGWTDDWSPEAVDRVLAWVAVADPWWFRPVEWLLLRARLHGLATRLQHWRTERAVRLYRKDRP